MLINCRFIHYFTMNGANLRPLFYRTPYFLGLPVLVIQFITNPVHFAIIIGLPLFPPENVDRLSNQQKILMFMPFLMVLFHLKCRKCYCIGPFHSDLPAQ